MNHNQSVWVRRTIILVLGLTVTLVGLVTWLVWTENGARQLIKFALSQTNAVVEVGEISGSIADGLSVSDINFIGERIELRLDTVDLQLDLSGVFKKHVVVESLIIRNVLILTPTNPTPNDHAKTAVELPSSIRLPFDLTVSQFSLVDVKAGSSVQSAQIVIDSLNFNGQWRDTELSLPQFTVSAPAATLDGTISVTTKAPYPLSFGSESQLKLEGFANANSTIALNGSLQQLDINFSIDQPYDVLLSGTATEILQSPQFDLDLSTEEFDLAGINVNYPEMIVSAALTVQGSLEKIGVKGRIDTELPKLGASSATFASLVFTDRIEIASLSLLFKEIENGSKLDASGQVSWGEAEPEANLIFAWDQLQWPLQGEHLVRSKDGRAILKGSLSDYSVSVSSSLSTRYETDGEIKVEAHGVPDRIDITSIHVDALEGQVQGVATLLLKPHISVSAKLRGTGINPASLLEDWPGSLDFTLDGTGTVAETGFSATLRELQGQGELRGYPLSFGGSALLAPGSIAIDGFNVNSGPTKIRLSGTVSDLLDVDWSLISTDLGSLWPGLSGIIESKGVVSGQPDQPQLTFSVKGEEIGYKEIRLKAVDADVNFGKSVAGSGVAQINVSGLEYGAYTSDSLKLTVEGTQEQHSIDISIEDTLGKSRVLFDGNLAEPNIYAFDLNKIDIEANELGIWSLLQPVAGSLNTGKESKPTITLPETCLTQNTSRLCLGLESIENGLAADVDLVDLPLSLLSHFIPSTIKASGKVNGGGNLKIDPGRGSYGSMQFDFNGLQLQSKIREDIRDSTLQFGSSVIKANIEQSGDVVLNADFPLVSGGGFTLFGNILSTNQKLLARPVTGRMSLSVPSAAFIADYLPQLSKAEGRLEGAVDLKGSLQKPQILGKLELSEGELTFADPGVQATDVEFSITGKPNNKLVIKASAKSGGGDIRLTGELALNEGERVGELRMSGTGFQVLNTQELQLWATPDITLKYANDQLELTGSVLIPRADINIDDLPQGTVKVSKDQIIVGEGEEASVDTIPVSAELLLSLGDNVHLAAFGLDAFLGGELELIEKTGKPTTATGEIQLRKGKYQAYGQKLNITTGRLVYAGGPIDQPGVDLRATRIPVSGIEVGVSARGTLSQPQFSVFSTPSMPESDQLAYLIFGRPINADAGSENTLITRLALSLSTKSSEAFGQKLAGGLGVDQLGVESDGSEDLSQASLVIGKYLSPKLFVSYGIGLLEPVSTLKLEYILNSKWQLVTESSSTRNSADAQYTYER